MSATHLNNPQPLPQVAPATRNGDLPPKHSLPPGSTSGRQRAWISKLLWRGTLGAVVLGLLLLGGNALLGWTGLFRQAPYTGPTWAVKKEKLRIVIVERGALEAAANFDILCRVKSGTKGGQASTSIKWVIEDGKQVEKGDKLVEFEDSALQDQLKNQLVLLAQANAARIQAEQNLLIQKSQNESDIATADVGIKLAKLDLRKYREGEYEQIKKDIQGRKEIARSDLEMWVDRAAWSLRMVRKGFLSRSQSDADQARLDSARIAVEKVDEEMRVLQNFTRERNETDLESKLAEALRAKERVSQQANFKLELLTAELKAKKEVYDLEGGRLKEIEEQIAFCKVAAPQAGMVVHYVSESSRFSSNSQSLIEVGAPVKEGQKLMRIPDLSKMVVNTRVHEAMVTYLHNDDPEYPEKRQHAQIRVDANAGRLLRGYVKSVATVPSQADFFSSDVKVYVTMVEIDEAVSNIKPGMSAEVTIFADESAAPVLTIPVQAVVGNITMGETRKCFVLDENNIPRERDITVGMSNENVVEVRKGLQEGERVVLNTKAVLPPDSNLKPAKSRGSGSDADAPGTGGKKGKGKGTGGKGPNGKVPGGPLGGGGVKQGALTRPPLFLDPTAWLDRPGWKEELLNQRATEKTQAG